MALAAERILTDSEFAKAILASDKCDNSFSGYLDKETRELVKSLVRHLKSVRNGKLLATSAREEFFSRIGIDPWEAAADALRGQMKFEGKQCEAAIRKIPVKLTTIQSSKGLAADLVIIANFDDRYFIRNKDKTAISDQDVCSFMVALTRARKKIVLIKTTDNDPTFLNWIESSRIRRA